MKLLLTGGGGAATQALQELWGGTYELHFADCAPERIPPCVPFARRHGIPRAASIDYCDAVLDLVTDRAIDLVIPCVDEELPVLERLRRFHDVALLLPDERYVHVMLDKFASIRWLRDAGIPVPYSHIVKPRRGRGSEGVYVEQEELLGPEYTVAMVADRYARLHAVVPVLVTEKKGITIAGRTDDHPEVVRACQAIHQAIPTQGTYNIQGILTAGGFKPFEINPRFSTTTCLAIAAGIDPVAIWYGDAPQGLARYRVQLGLRRYWQTVIT